MSNVESNPRGITKLLVLQAVGKGIHDIQCIADDIDRSRTTSSNNLNVLTVTGYLREVKTKSRKKYYLTDKGREAIKKNKPLLIPNNKESSNRNMVTVRVIALINKGFNNYRDIINILEKKGIGRSGVVYSLGSYLNKGVLIKIGDEYYLTDEGREVIRNQLDKRTSTETVLRCLKERSPMSISEIKDYCKEIAEEDSGLLNRSLLIRKVNIPEYEYKISKKGLDYLSRNENNVYCRMLNAIRNGINTRKALYENKVVTLSTVKSKFYNLINEGLVEPPPKGYLDNKYELTDLGRKRLKYYDDIRKILKDI